MNLSTRMAASKSTETRRVAKKKELTCSYCRSVPHQIVCLICGHDICIECFSCLLKLPQKPKETNIPRSFECAICHQVTELTKRSRELIAKHFPEQPSTINFSFPELPPDDSRAEEASEVHKDSVLQEYEQQFDTEMNSVLEAEFQCDYHHLGCHEFDVERNELLCAECSRSGRPNVILWRKARQNLLSGIHNLQTQLEFASRRAKLKRIEVDRKRELLHAKVEAASGRLELILKAFQQSVTEAARQAVYSFREAVECAEAEAASMRDRSLNPEQVQFLEECRKVTPKDPSSERRILAFFLSNQPQLERRPPAISASLMPDDSFLQEVAGGALRQFSEEVASSIDRVIFSQASVIQPPEVREIVADSIDRKVARKSLNKITTPRQNPIAISSHRENNFSNKRKETLESRSVTKSLEKLKPRQDYSTLFKKPRSRLCTKSLAPVERQSQEQNRLLVRPDYLALSNLLKGGRKSNQRLV